MWKQSWYKCSQDQGCDGTPSKYGEDNAYLLSNADKVLHFLSVPASCFEQEFELQDFYSELSCDPNLEKYKWSSWVINDNS